MTEKLPDSFVEFGARELNSTLSVYERTGFPDRFRKGFTPAIFRDIKSKLTALGRRRARILDVGCGASPLTERVLKNAKLLGQRVDLIDHQNVLRALSWPTARKHAGRFPADHAGFIKANSGTCDAILVYSVIQYVFRDDDLAAFIDACLALLKPGGRLLLGDIPNSSQRARFLSSPGAAAYHQAHFAGQPTAPRPTTEIQISDDDLLRVVARARAAGMHAYLMPQNPDLPFANRREDLLIERPS